MGIMRNSVGILKVLKHVLSYHEPRVYSWADGESFARAHDEYECGTRNDNGLFKSRGRYGKRRFKNSTRKDV